MTQAMKVIGIGDDGTQSLLPLYRTWIEESELLVGGERHLSFFPDYPGEKLVLKGGLTAMVEQLREEKRKTVILASGDPLFYGIGSLLAKKLQVEIYPHLSSIQLAFARVGEAWQDAAFLSVHGRSIKGLAQRIDGKEKVALLTDQENNPAAIARYLLSFGMNEYDAFVGENLGSAGERTGWYSLEEMADGVFADLNVVILRKRRQGPIWPLGIADEQFSQRKPDKGLITKKEVRILSIAQLQLHAKSIVWDIGTCTGSVAIEAARIAREGEVYAVEKNADDLANCRENMAKFRTDFTVVHAKAPEGLDQFPDPDAVFIGGSGGELRELLGICCSRLRPNGRIVVNAATIETLYEATQAFAAEGFETSVTLAQLSRSKPILSMTRFEGLNPIYIITAWAKQEDKQGGDSQ
ncbi:bifunctional cobalt-precorrin-7 (C(5))-methyltransferase/cobalt-precorrin-6B (C(15))-methyltransferase [Brevibacillus borstelensis]|uniref:bifunctional cobalt-precorrin-7 (C(5))-methyltransferase/cobalt-precorrin-6B (C(15))-methyltransferase n=1 Tax=Brevibacillus borstelensis TaxID=45462 RepID=UPI00057BD120|nr:bifunctional cobalt-precorrin-7 (C(5))-methyltransferase/cobalt-precorrin-6B (C(15))-methyltransferase [Brevibacillus borstelensis]MCC0563635.1 bifunctional cobalt-precorrin-7 (C(5))-methyltransferase/cobalt-precorrin-6B (C(15))-methyltransferase [Brevibacillus borstelensis]MCM3469279.1 bifunctional cobalt-precorrin-7 (C(5))-methyltransferase/cobalt-precorrin-6B (C(15))-methyltransferase [Brevibacillus borstelensis]MCM3558773.1 bifunctional cobalt-precorrin-7 (C(5))-methyltransferase/cobalt-p